MVITISEPIVLISSIAVSGFGDQSTIATFGGTLQMLVSVLPENATNKSVVWSVENGTGEATISESGLLTAVANGTVTVKATSLNQPTIFGSYVVTISNQEILVTSVTVTTVGDVVVIDTMDGTLLLSAEILPLDATNQMVIWSVENGTGSATIDQDGLLTAVLDGTVTVKATSDENALIFGTKVITISNQDILVTSVTVTTVGDVVVIDTMDGTLLLSAEILPLDATNQMVVWSVENGTGEATIDQDGLLTAVYNGTVTVKATSDENALIFGTKEITISNQGYPEDLVDLGTAGDFAILAKTGISSTGASLVVGNIGVSPAAATYITGFSLILDSSTEFSTSAQVVGMVYAASYTEPTPTNLTTAVSNMEAAYTDAAGRTPDFTELYAGDLSGQTLVGGVYKYSSNVVIYTNVTLTGDATDVWIFQIAGTFTQAANVQIILGGGALAENVFWQIADSVAIETGAHFVGIILAMTEITVGTNASVNGKLLSQTAVTLDENQVTLEEIIDVVSVTVSSTGDAVIIDSDNGTLQMLAEVLPVDATNQAVVWSVENGTGEATIDEVGLLTAVSNGTVTVKATAGSNVLIFDTFEVTISNQIVLIESIVVSSAGDAIVITVDDGTLQMSAAILPLDTTNQDFTWSVENGTGEATIDLNGLVTAVADGTVTVKATSDENVLIFGTFDLTLSNQVEVLLAVDLGTAADYVILAQTGITTTGVTLITGDIAVNYIAASMTGFGEVMDVSNTYSTSALVVGMIYAADYAVPTPDNLITAQADMHDAYNDAAGRTEDFLNLHGTDIGGQILVPGVYKYTTALSITTHVTLSGSATDVWIFQIAGTFTQAADMNVLLTGGALPENIFWQVAGAVTLGAGAHFEGTILGMTGVSLGAGATLNGRIYAQTAVALGGNIIN